MGEDLIVERTVYSVLRVKFSVPHRDDTVTVVVGYGFLETRKGVPAFDSLSVHARGEEI